LTREQPNGLFPGKEMNMTGLVTESIQVLDQQSIDSRILALLEDQGAHLLDELDRILPDVGSARFLLAIDRLSRAGKIRIGPPANGDYLVSAILGRHAAYRHSKQDERFLAAR
jgi:hypothetical protein